MNDSPFTYDKVSRHPDDDDEDTDDEESEGGEYSEPFEPGSQQAIWMNLPLEKKFKQVMKSLISDYRWSDDGEMAPGRPPLEEWKKIGLLKDSSKKQKSTPTFVHLLAKNGKDFCQLDKIDRREMVKDALDRYQSENCLPPGDPILSVAVLDDNDDFIDCLIDCSGTYIGALIRQKDHADQNYLHTIFRPHSVGHLQTKAEKEKGREAVRHQALMRGRKIIDVAPPEAIAAKDSKGNTPLHYAMRYRLSAFRQDDYVQLVKDMLEKGDPHALGTTCWLNNMNDSPILHYGRTKDKFEERENEKQEKIKAAREKKNEAVREEKAQPPTGVDSQAQPLHKHMTQRPLASGDRSKPEQERFTSRKDMIDRRRPGPPETRIAKELSQHLERSSQRSNTIDRTARDTRGASQPERHSISTSGFALSPATLNAPHQNDRQSNAARKVIDSGSAQTREHPEARRPTAVHKPMPKDDSSPALLGLFTRHYLRTRTDLEARNLIYGLNRSVINLSLDASGHDKAADIVQLINRMSHGGFSETLAYVSIPTVANEEPKGKPKLEARPVGMNQGVPMQKNDQNPSPGKAALTDVFDKLYKQNVRCILNLEVEDRRPLSHTDTAIEMALRGRDSFGLNGGLARPIAVETWDWRKPDLSIDVISFAAPDVVNLNLYWSGNEAVLKGWSCPDGIPKLKKLKSLKIIAAPGLETRARMDKLLEKFKLTIKGSRNETMQNLQIEHKAQMYGLMRDLDSPRNGSSWISAHVQGEDQHAWIQQMEGFRSALRTIHDELAKAKVPEPERVKVALLDDGVDLNQLTPYYGRSQDGTDKDLVLALGVSCCDFGRSPSNWAISSRGHGTIMANMILRINPWVQLYSMKIQDGEDAVGRRTIFPGSAANAIQGAIDLNASIISMSWSIRNKIQPLVPIPVLRTKSDSVVEESGGGVAMAREGSPMKALEVAVEKATERGTLMFCSATDDIQNGAMDFLPYQKGQNYIFRIGAATAQGERDPHTEDEKNIDYFFPGNQVADAMNPRSERQVKYHDGSSVSTALAAGLSSLIMYLARVMCAYHKHLGNNDRSNTFEELAGKLKVRNNMRQAFDNINNAEWPNKKFLPVWGTFEERTKKIKETRNLDDKMRILEVLVVELCTKLR